MSTGYLEIKARAIYNLISWMSTSNRCLHVFWIPTIIFNIIITRLNEFYHDFSILLLGKIYLFYQWKTLHYKLTSCTELKTCFRHRWLVLLRWRILFTSNEPIKWNVFDDVIKTLEWRKNRYLLFKSPFILFVSNFCLFFYNPRRQLLFHGFT